MSAATAQQTPRSPLGESTRSDLQRAAQVFELWRLCRKARCRRAHACRDDARACCEMLADWAEVLSLKDKRVGFAEAVETLRERSAAGRG